MKTKIILIIFIIICIIIVFLSCNQIFFKYKNKISLENSIKIFEDKNALPFYIDKIILYSSAYGENQTKTFTQKSLSLDLYQYTDIAIFLSSNSSEIHEYNSIKKLYLSDVCISTYPKVGMPNLYYLDSKKFGSYYYSEENKFEENLNFTVLNDSNSENAIQSNTPVLFSDLSNPITIKYINKINSKFEQPFNEIIFFNGNLLKKANIALKDLISTIKLKINLISNDNQIYFYNLNIDIPIYNETSNIYSGYIVEMKKNLNYQFLK